VSDVVLHLAQTEELVVAGAGSDEATFRPGREASRSVDAEADALVRAQQAPPDVVFARWRAARRGALDVLRRTDAHRTIPWVAQALRPGALATTRLAEHWAHGLDVTGPLGIELADTDRLRHVAWLAHRTLPYAFALEDQEPPAVRCELVGPHGDIWELGDPDSPSRITGPGGDFCRVGAHRLTPADSRLEATGPYGPRALQLLRNYAA
jgi:uncharacterized protein (TIGR03084 family)